MTLAANSACKNLNIAKGNSSTNNTYGRVALSTYDLEVSGSLRNYYAAVNTIPGTSSTAIPNQPITTAGGALKIVGGTRTLVSSSEWGNGTYVASNTLFPIVFAPNSGATITLNSTLRAQSWTFNSGTVSMTTACLVHADNGQNNQGDVTVNSNALLILNGTGSSNSLVRRSSGKKGGTFTVNGTLRFTGAAPYLAMTTIAFNGTVEYTGNNQSLVNFGGDGATTPNVYTNLVISGTGTTTIPFNITVNGNVTVNPGSTLSNGSYTLGLGDTASYTREVSGSGSIFIDLPSFTIATKTFDTDVTLSTFAAAASPGVTFAWKPVEVDLTGAGATFTTYGADLSGKTMKVRHSLGFTPMNAYWRMKNGSDVWGSWNELTTGLDGTFVEFTLPAKAQGDVQLVLPEDSNTQVQTLPVELSSFTGTPTAEYYIQLHWITQSETNITGYVVYRSQEADLEHALAITGLMEAANSANITHYYFTDEDVLPGTWYYWLAINEFDGSHTYHGPLQVILVHDVEEPEVPTIPIIEGISKIFPNPFNPATTISYILTAPANTKVSIFNMRGEKVREIFTGYQEIGNYTVVWDGKTTNGTKCASGIYYARLESGNLVQTRKMVMTK